ncbi:hypothetical protein BKA62DRAFT_695631 [Auriculariales sp. MPI-PUGE-AT-0066]|nr:hypothetical protein BKA62DRAFT_695631 [Auriculariales sp. MPI-PUGE-AT-0066]
MQDHVTSALALAMLVLLARALQLAAHKLDALALAGDKFELDLATTMTLTPTTVRRALKPILVRAGSQTGPAKRVTFSTEAPCVVQ